MAWTQYMSDTQHCCSGSMTESTWSFMGLQLCFTLFYQPISPPLPPCSDEISIKMNILWDFMIWFHFESAGTCQNCSAMLEWQHKACNNQALHLCSRVITWQCRIAPLRCVSKALYKGSLYIGVCFQLTKRLCHCLPVNLKQRKKGLAFTWIMRCALSDSSLNNAGHLKLKQ